MARISLWQRDLGHVNDRDRLPRIHALDHLNRSLISTPISTAASDLRIRFIADHLTKVFVEKLVNDPVERCRDLCLSIIVGLIQKLGTRDNCRLAHNLIPIISFRFGNTPEKEPVEELRLRLIETCSAILSRTALEIGSAYTILFAQNFTMCLLPAMIDTFPRAKRAALSGICGLCRVAPQKIGLCFEHLAKILVSNLTHQHAKTRIIVLNTIVDVCKATCASVVSNAFPRSFLEVILPALCKASVDRSATVRVRLANSLGTWQRSGLPPNAINGGSPEMSSATALLAFDVDIFARLVDLMADATTDVSATAVAEMNAISFRWHKVSANPIPNWSISEVALLSMEISAFDCAINTAHLLSNTAAHLLTYHSQNIISTILALTKRHWAPSMRPMPVLMDGSGIA